LVARHDDKFGPYAQAKTTTFYRLALYAPRDAAIVELGTSRGFGTVALGLGARDGGGQDVYTVDTFERHTNWIGGDERGDLHKPQFLALCGDAGVRPRLVPMDVMMAADWWTKGAIGLLVWDLGMRDRMKQDFLAWHGLVVPGGRFAFRDVDNRALGSAETIASAIERGWEKPQEWPQFIWSVDKCR
jgi:hypothetical protein